MTRPPLLLAAIGTALLCAACRDSTPPPPPPPAPGTVPAAQVPVPAPPGQPAAPQVQPADDQPCVAGRWRANDFLQAVRWNLGRSVREEGGQLTAAGGHITFIIAPPDASGTGQIEAIAEDLVHRARTQERGITVNVTHTMTGRALMPYTQPLPTHLLVGDPTESTLRSRINLSATGGLRFNRSSSPRTDLSGLYEFECTPTELKVWQRRPSGRRGMPLVFDRVTDTP